MLQDDRDVAAFLPKRCASATESADSSSGGTGLGDAETVTSLRDLSI